MTWLLLLAVAAPPASFRNEAMAVLSRAGCASGPCHGNLYGKGGFKLSLRGQDAEADFVALTRDALGRRIDRLAPRASLLLAKATMALPHEGGQRFSASSPEYAVLRRWIAEGARLDSPPRPVRLVVAPAESIIRAPVDRVALKAVASFSDGSVRDVTRLACFEPSTLGVAVDPAGVVRRLSHGESAVLVRYLDTQAVARVAFVPARPDFAWKEQPEANYIDRLVHARLKALRVEPSPTCTDAEFLRRASLDACGILPTAERARAFLADKRPDKRARLVEELLARPEFADFWALKWADLLRAEEKALDAKGVRLFHAWIRQSILDGKPLDRFARELVAGMGSTYSRPASNYYRALREPYERAEATAQVFLGTRIGCAKCHNHPFDRWKQSDYHAFAAFFARVKYRILENKKRDKLDKHAFVGEQVVYQDRAGELRHPGTGAVLVPRFLGGAELPAARDRLGKLAEWIGSADNPYFARAQADRIWQHLVGRGLVDPVDDARASNPATCEPLLDALADDLKKGKFDLRHLVRRIMASRTYQRSSRPTRSNGDDQTGLSRALVRPMQAEVLLDAVAGVCGARPRFAGMPTGTRAVQLPGHGGRRARSEADKFLAAFGKPPRSLSCECERSDDSTLAQALHLLAGPLLAGLLERQDNILGKMERASDDAVFDRLYLSALCRLPSRAERAAASALVARSKDRRAGLEDLLWSLLNAKEFLLRR